MRLADLQDELREFVMCEQEAQRVALARLWAKPVWQRVEEGRCLTGGRLKTSRLPRSVIIEFAANDSMFRDGDFVRVSFGNPEDPLAEAVVVQADDEWVELEVWCGASELAVRAGQRMDLQIDQSAMDLERHYLAAIDDLGKTEVGREILLPLLAGERKTLLDIQVYDDAFAKGQGGGLGDEQSAALASALASDPCWLIHGPPGTGKTRVLAWAVRELILRGERILVTSANHRAINNLLDAITKLTGDYRGIYKIAPYCDPLCAAPHYESFAQIPRRETAGAFVIGATPFALRSKRLAGVDFDLIIMDEASQVTVPLAIMAMLAAKRYILAGDNRQLPPVQLSNEAGLSRWASSIFECLIGRGMDSMLTTTHRLNEPLCEWPSETFYLSRLKPSAVAAGRRLCLTRCSGEFADVLLPEPACIWLSVPHDGSRTSSSEEIEVTARLLLALREGGVRWEEVAVVVPFRRQARLLRQRLRRELRQPLSSFGLVADTVERMQGQEREVVIVSFAASERSFVCQTAKFLFQPQRLNVAATRARTKLVIVASPALLEHARDLCCEEADAFLSFMKKAHRIEHA